MTDESTSRQSSGPAESPADPGEALLRDSLTKYRGELESDLDSAQGRYGFTLFHSLAPEEKVTHLERLGFEPRDSIDHYNLGCVAALQENFEAAVEHFQRAAGEDASWYEAAHNLALALERAGRKADAQAQWKRAAELAPDEERAAVSGHLAELG